MNNISIYEFLKQNDISAIGINSLPSIFASEKQEIIGSQQDKQMAIGIINGEVTRLIIPASFDQSSRPFSDCLELEYVKLEDGITTIPFHCFYNNIKLKTVILPTTLTEIPSYTFSNCQALSEITIPMSVKNIDTGAFEGCGQLTSLTLPGVVSITGSDVIKNSGVQEIVLPNVSRIDSRAFSDAPALSTIRIGKPKDAIPGAPWGAPTSYGVPNATIIWEG